MIRRIATMPMLVVSVASCAWPMSGQGPDRRNWNGTDHTFTPSSLTRLREGWHVPIVAGTEVVGDRDRVFTRSQGALKALEPTTGNELWTAGAPGTSVPGLIGDGVVVGIDGPRCTLQRLAAASGASQVTATVGYAYGNNATARSCVMGPSVLTESGRVAVSSSSTATFAVPGCGGTSNNQLWGAASTVTVLDATLRPIWTATDATIGCGTPPDQSPIALFGEVTRTDTHYVAPKGNELIAYPLTCTDPCAASWRATFSSRVTHAAGLPGGRVAVAPEQSRVSVLADATGDLLWTLETNAPFGFAATDTTIFVLSLELNAYPVNGCGAATCNPAWTAPLGGRIAFYEPVVAGDVLIAPAWEGPGLFFDARGCGAATCTNLPGAAPGFGVISGAVSVVNGRIYAAGDTTFLTTSEIAPA